jgi:superoxide dismutase, Fe-Mn family
MQYTPRVFTIPTLSGLSKESVDAHLGLYAAYVKNFNDMTALAGELMQDPAKNAHAIAEIMRRRSFEFGGMRLHELYFAQFEGGAVALETQSTLNAALTAQYGDPKFALAEIRQVAMMRGPGWALLYFDPQVGQFLVGFSGEQHQGHFAGLPIMLALDVWEHAYLLDHSTQGKGAYVDAFFNNLNWKSVEQRFEAIK